MEKINESALRRKPARGVVTKSTRAVIRGITPPPPTWKKPTNALAFPQRVKSPVPLSAARKGQRLRILSLPSHPALRQRLHSMGIEPGAEVEVLRRGFPGGLLHVACGLLEFMLREDQAAEMTVALIQPRAAS